MLTALARAFHHYGHAFEVRGLVLSEYLRARCKSRSVPAGLLWKIWRNPSRFEDFVNLARFIDSDDRTLLIDVGGNVGDWASDFRLFFPNSDIVAFEPDPRAYAAYAARFRTAARVTVHNIALSNMKGEAMFRMAEESVYSSLEAYASTQDERNIRLADACKVPLETLDSVAIDMSDYESVVLKIDVQGHEIEVLQGAARTLRAVDVVIGELTFAGEYEGKPPSFAAACSLLHEAGLFPAVFQCYGRELGPYAFERDVVFARQERLNRMYGWA